MLWRIRPRAKWFWTDERGQTLVEYVVILAPAVFIAATFVLLAVGALPR